MPQQLNPEQGALDAETPNLIIRTDPRSRRASHLEKPHAQGFESSSAARTFDT